MLGWAVLEVAEETGLRIAQPRYMGRWPASSPSHATLATIQRSHGIAPAWAVASAVAW